MHIIVFEQGQMVTPIRNHVAFDTWVKKGCVYIVVNMVDEKSVYVVHLSDGKGTISSIDNWRSCSKDERKCVHD